MEDTLNKAIEKYGELHQLIVAMEECSELNQAISKVCRRWRGEDALIKEMGNDEVLDNLSEEMADVYICFHQLLIMFNNQYDVQRHIDYTEIYTRAWQPNGLITTNVYRLATDEKPKESLDDRLGRLEERITEIEKRGTNNGRAVDSKNSKQQSNTQG